MISKGVAYGSAFFCSLAFCAMDNNGSASLLYLLCILWQAEQETKDTIKTKKTIDVFCITAEKNKKKRKEMLMSTWSALAVVDNDKVTVVTGGIFAYDGFDPEVRKTWQDLLKKADSAEALIDVAIKYQEEHNRSAIKENFEKNGYDFIGYRHLEIYEFPYDAQNGGFSFDILGDAGQFGHIKNLMNKDILVSTSVYDTNGFVKSKVFTLGSGQSGWIRWDGKTSKELSYDGDFNVEYDPKKNGKPLDQNDPFLKKEFNVNFGGPLYVRWTNKDGSTELFRADIADDWAGSCIIRFLMSGGEKIEDDNSPGIHYSIDGLLKDMRSNCPGAKFITKDEAMACLA